MGSLIVSRIRNMVHERKRNCLILVVGETGSGKSWTCVSLAEQIQPGFDAESQVVFSALEFIRLINSKKLRFGDVIVFEESGINYDSRSFMSATNQALNYITQSFRNMRLVVFFNCPHNAMLDKNIRRLFHYQLTTQSIDYDTGICTLKPFEISVSNIQGHEKIYNKYPRGLDQNGEPCVFTALEVPKPSEANIDKYEVKKLAFTTALNLKAQATLESLEYRKSRPEPQKMEDMMKNVMANLSKYTKPHGKRTIINRQLLEHDFNIGQSKSMQLKAQIELALTGK